MLNNNRRQVGALVGKETELFLHAFTFLFKYKLSGMTFHNLLQIYCFIVEDILEWIKTHKREAATNLLEGTLIVV